MTLKEWLEKRAAAGKVIEDLHAKFNAEGYEATAEDEQEWQRVNDDFNAIDKRTEQSRDMESVQTRLEVGTGRTPPPSSRGDDGRRESAGDVIPEAEARSLSLQAWCARSADRDLTERQTMACAQLGTNPNAREFDIQLGTTDEVREIRAAIGSDPQTVTTTAGGYAIPTGFVPELERAMLAFGGMRAASRVIRTATGNQLEWPTIDDTGNTGELLAINTAVAEVAVVLAQKLLDAYKFSSKAVTVPFELLQDSAFNLDSELASILGVRLGRVTNTYYTTGTGSSQPQGIFAASGGVATGVTAASATAYTYDEIVALVHSVDASYRNNPGAAFMFHDNQLATIRKLQDGNGNAMWGEHGLTSKEPTTLLGYPYFVNQDLTSTILTTNKTLYFGDFHKFVIREVAGLRMRRLDELQAAEDQVVFIAFLRGDSEYVGSAGGAIKLLIQA